MGNPGRLASSVRLGKAAGLQRAAGFNQWRRFRGVARVRGICFAPRRGPARSAASQRLPEGARPDVCQVRLSSSLFLLTLT